MATYGNDLRLKEIATGDESGTWGTSTNTNLSLIADAFSYGEKQMPADANVTFTMPDGTADALRASYLKITSAVTLTAGREITLAPNTVSKVWTIENDTTGTQTIQIRQGSGSIVAIPKGFAATIYTNGAGATASVVWVGDKLTTKLDGNSTGVLPASKGGTGLSSLTANNVILGNGTSAVLLVAPGSSGNVLSSNGTTWQSAAPAVTLANPNAFTGSNTFYNASGQTFGTGTVAHDGIVVAGRAGGAASFRVTLIPAVMSASRTLSLPDPGSNETLGYQNIPQNSRSADYTLVLTDSGKHILHPSADTTARTFTIPANGSVAFPVGTAVTFINQNAAGVITIAITTDTMRLAGPGTTGSRTLAANGVATAVKITSTEWLISGTGLT